MSKTAIALVTPALAAANNGNWQTASRWARMLAADYRVALCDHWAGGDEQLMVALHARRSAASVQAWRRRHPDRPLIVVLTGTDLYRDIATDAQAQASLAAADTLVVLNDCGRAALPEALRAKAQVCLQSAPPRQAHLRPQRHLRALMVGHLREEKAPDTYWAAARLLRHRTDIRLDHIGAGLDPALADGARALAAEQLRYRWLGALPHGATRSRIQAASVLVHPSRLEGGAHVVIEAITAGTPVLASRIDGNLGLLGAGYPGYFAPGDAAGLAALLERARDDPAFLPALDAHVRALQPRFTPQAERATLGRIIRSTLDRA